MAKNIPDGWQAMATATTTRRSRDSGELRPDQVMAIVDSREQYPLDLSPLHTVAGTLTTADYSVLGLVNVVAIERKSLSDLLACIGQHRARFDREVLRLLAYPTRAIVIEATWGDLEAGEWRSQVTPAAAVGSVLGWVAAGVPVLLAGDHARAGRFVGRLLFTAARRRWREARALVRAPTRAAVTRGAASKKRPKRRGCQQADKLAEIDGF